MNDAYRGNQLSKPVLVMTGLFVLTGGLCLAGKPGGSGSKEVALTIVIDDPEGYSCWDTDTYNDPGLCADLPGAAGDYVYGESGVRSVIVTSTGGFQFTTDYWPVSPPRMVNILLGSDGLEVPIRLAINWNIQSIPVGSSMIGGMGGNFSAGGAVYTLRWDSAKGASPVLVTRTADGWVIESTGGHLVSLTEYKGKGRSMEVNDLGLFDFPFKLVLTIN